MENFRLYFRNELELSELDNIMPKLIAQRGYVTPLQTFEIYGGLIRNMDIEILSKREERQRRLADYLKEHPNRFILVDSIINYLLLQRYYDIMSLQGDYFKVQKWDKIEAPHLIRKIRDIAKSLNVLQEIGDIIGLIFLSMPEFFVASRGSYPQEKLNEFYQQIERGDYYYFQHLINKILSIK